MKAGRPLRRISAKSSDQEHRGDRDGGDAIGLEAALGAIAPGDQRRIVCIVRRGRGVADAAMSVILFPVSLHDRSAMKLRTSVKKNSTKPSAKAESVLASRIPDRRPGWS